MLDIALENKVCANNKTEKFFSLKARAKALNKAPSQMKQTSSSYFYELFESGIELESLFRREHNIY